MTYSDAFNIRTTSVKFNDVADAIDGTLTRSYVSTTTGTSTAYIATPSPAWLSYTDAPFIIIVPHVDNGSGGTTINVSSLGAKSIKRAGVNISAGALKASTPAFLIYNSSGGYFELLITENTIRQDGTNSPTADINWGGYNITNLSKLKLAASTAPFWDTSTYFWLEGGFGTRYDGYQHRFDVGNSRTEAMRINTNAEISIGTVNSNGKLTIKVADDRDFVVGKDVTGNKHVESKLIYDQTTSFGSAVNIELNAGTDYLLRRSTSSAKYKKDIETLDSSVADKLMQLRSVYYRSNSPTDVSWFSTYGLIAEEVAEVDPRLAVFKFSENDYESIETTLEDGSIANRKTLKKGAVGDPEGVNYNAVLALAINVIQRLSAKVEALEVQNGNRG